MTASPPFLHLPLFDGPLDLLLHLCRRHELEVAALPVAEVTEQFLVYLEVLEELRVEVAGEFVEMAALLCLLKSREMLPPIDLPDELEDEEGEDPRAALIARLLDYRQFKEAAYELDDAHRPGRDFFGRPMDPRSAAGLSDTDAPIDADLTAMLAALRDLLQERAKAEPVHAVVGPMVPLEERMADVLRQLAAGPKKTELRRLFGAAVTQAGVVATFLAILHLAHLGHLRLVQPEHLQSIVVVRRFTGPPPVLVQEDVDER